MFIYQGSIIANFLGQNGRQYKIPVYQRNYEWSWEQCDKLFEDVVTAGQRNQLHFCGSIVFKPIAPTKGIGNNIVIDGQQRLTTIYILLKALSDMAQNDSEKMLPQGAIFNTDQYNQFQLDETSKMKLKPAKDNNDQLLDLIYDKHDKIDTTCEIYRNYEHFCDLIRGKQAEGITVSDIYRGIGLLTVAVIQLDDNDNAQEIFERINSTGIPLSLSDKIRNFVLMTEVDQDRLYESYWLKAEQILSRDQLEGFFLDYLNFKMDGFTKESTAYDDFKALYVRGRYTNETMLGEILHYAQQYHAFYCGDKLHLSNEANQFLDSIRKLNQTTVYIFLFSVFDDFEAGVIDDETLCKVLRLLLNYSIRRLICEVGSNSLRGLYKTLYGRVFNRPENKNNYYDAIVSFLLQLTSKDVMPSDAEFVVALKERNLYRKNALCKYLLVAIENQGKEQIKTDALTIEHIMPQNKNLSTAWQKMLGSDWELVRERYLHTLGNLTLTGYNSELGDLPFAEKLDMLSDKNTHVTVLYSDVKDKTEWNAQTIEARSERLSKKVLKLFPIELPTTKIDFSDPRYQLYTVADPHNATYKWVNYYELLGERVNVDSFALMVRSVAGKLYNLNSSIIDRMARSLEVFPAWQNPVFAYDKDAIRNAVKLKNDSDIYISTGYSAYDCICFIKALLKKYDLDLEEDFVYSARPSNIGTGINRLAMAQKWCEKQAEAGRIEFDADTCEGRYVRFTTPFLNQAIPTNKDVLSPWRTSNYYFYEITNFKNELYVQLYFYCKGITDEMRTAFLRMAELTDGGKLTQGYRLFFKSTVFANSENDTEEVIMSQLDKCLEEIHNFEAPIQSKWNS
ncbi:DUF262 domain-containing protein [Faecalibacterium sp. Marseille-Q3530]|uniref:DUF262 domain-containing protein n=1 Tax=Faecalibacterium sp. Marseille-Q3530 TaxID=2758403 RepID=UPI001A9BF4E8|nr:DUF262 domain-containing protein [Faecalibacterium sp. Marseille-Q3530]MBO1288612.1 DUF262 domain-containing protein [Faecalibacterium sp. Marseille-Q3530]